MAAKKRQHARGADPLKEAAIELFAARSHDAWRRTLLKTNPEQKGRPRMRSRGGVMVDVNQPWAKLHANAKRDNLRAAEDAYAAVRKFPGDREAAADYVHQRWMKRNKNDPSQPRALFKPYSKLSKVEKDKDRAHVDLMTKAVQAASKKPSIRTAKPVKSARRRVAVEIDAATWRRLEAAAAKLSARTARPVSATELLDAGLEAMASVFTAIAAQERARK